MNLFQYYEAVKRCSKTVTGAPARSGQHRCSAWSYRRDTHFVLKNYWM